MTALLASTVINPEGLAVADDFGRRLPGLGLGALRLLVQALQERRGTVGEQPGDAARTQRLDHEINSRLTVSALAREFRRLDDGTAPFPA